MFDPGSIATVLVPLIGGLLAWMLRRLGIRIGNAENELRTGNGSGNGGESLRGVVDLIASTVTSIHTKQAGMDGAIAELRADVKNLETRWTRAEGLRRTDLEELVAIRERLKKLEAEWAARKQA